MLSRKNIELLERIGSAETTVEDVGIIKPLLEAAEGMTSQKGRAIFLWKNIAKIRQAMMGQEDEHVFVGGGQRAGRSWLRK